MYPEIRLIGRVEKVEDNSPNPYERTISLKVVFRNGSHGTLRVRTPLGDRYDFRVGDEVFVSGELDEFGSIHPHRSGVIRKLAPVLVQPKPSKIQADTPKLAKESDDAVSSSPNQTVSLDQEHGSQPTMPPVIQPASTSIPRSAAFLFKGNARRSSSNVKTEPHPSPTSTTQPESKSDTQPTGTTNAVIRSFTKAYNQTLQFNALPKPTSKTSSLFTEPNTSKGRLGNNRPLRNKNTNELQSDLAEYIQDEIPW